MKIKIMDLITKQLSNIAVFVQKHKLALLLIFIYGLSIIYISCFHEVWRDEARALNISINSKSIIDLFYNIHNEGHPALWYLIVRFGYELIRTKLILKIASILVAVGAISIFVFKSPFSWIQKILFVFGYFPIYEYSVISRNYGISMLLLFLFCCFYKQRFKRFFLVSVILFLLANTNAPSAIFVIAIFISMLIELICSWNKNIKADIKINKIIAGFAIIIAGVLCALIQSYPDSTSLISGPHLLSLSNAIKACIKVLASPGSQFYAAFGFNILLTNFIIWLLCIYLLFKKPVLFAIFFISTIALGTFFLVIYPPALRQQGLLYILIISVLWMDKISEKKIPEERTEFKTPLIKITKEVLSKAVILIFYLLLLFQVLMAYPAIKKELYGEFSSSKSFAIFLKSRPELKNAILIGEPDYAIESISYYAENQIYIPREKRFGDTVKFTTQNKSSLSLGELLNAAQMIKNNYNRPVLILLGHNLERCKNYKLVFSYGKIFTCYGAQVPAFLNDTVEIASFHPALNDENYDVYLVK